MQRKMMPDVVHDQNLLCLESTATVREAAELMRGGHAGSVLVIDQGKLVGIITERDVVCRVVAADLDPESTEIRAVMTENPDTVSPRTTALDALRRMQDGGYRHLPVVDGGKVVGVVSRRDFFGAEKARLDEETAIWEHIG